MTYSELKSLGLSIEQLKQLKRNVQMLIEDIAVDNVQSMRVGSKVPSTTPRLQVYGR